MGRTVYRRMDILKQIADAVTGIGEKVFITDRPAAEQKAMKDFCCYPVATNYPR